MSKQERAGWVGNEYAKAEPYPPSLLLLILFGKVTLFPLLLIVNELRTAPAYPHLFTFTLFVLRLVIQGKGFTFEPATEQKKPELLNMAKRRVVRLKRAEFEQVFIKLRAGRFNNLGDTARLLGLTLREALDLDRQLNEEVILEKGINELKQLASNGNH